MPVVCCRLRLRQFARAEAERPPGGAFAGRVVPELRIVGDRDIDVEQCRARGSRRLIAEPADIVIEDQVEVAAGR